jgi:hypothetical protein
VPGVLMQSDRVVRDLAYSTLQFRLNGSRSLLGLPSVKTLSVVLNPEGYAHVWRPFTCVGDAPLSDPLTGGRRTQAKS